MALLCVLLAHVLVIWFLANSFDGARRGLESPISWSEPITLFLPPEEPEPPPPPPGIFSAPGRPTERVVAAPEASVPAQTSATKSTENVDWPLEGKKAATRVLAREAEAERIARMFAGPGGTWASLTKRQRSKLNKFRFKAGIDGLEYDSQGNQIYHISDGCMVVNSGYIACKIGKVKVRGDMFENMREYFDELRLPETNDGNGTEPEALRPPY